jgi:hypothetical protein
VTRNLEFAKSLLTVVEGYSIVGFRPLAVEDARSMASANDLINAALGFL